MISKVKVTFGNLSSHVTEERIFESRNSAMMWINKKMSHQSGLKSVHELFFRMESYYDVPKEVSYNSLPF